MDDRFSNPQFNDESSSKAAMLKWSGGILVLGGLTFIFMKFLAPEFLDFFGGDSPELIRNSVAMVVAGIFLFGVGGIFNKKQQGDDRFGAHPSVHRDQVPQGSETSSMHSGREDFSLPEGREKLADTGDDEQSDDDESDHEEENESFEDDGETDDSLLELDAAWKTSKIIYNPKIAFFVLAGIALFWNAISLPLMFPISRDIRAGQWGLIIFAFFPIIGLFLLGFAIRGLIQLARFGTSQFEIQNRMGRIGESLKGTIRSSVSVVPVGNYEVKLSCKEVITTGSGKHKNTRVETRWEGKQTFDPNSHQVFLGIPVSFEIPTDCPESYDDHTRGRIDWDLSISAPMSGVDYEAQFKVPVFRRRKQ